MRRKDKEITDKNEIESIIEKATLCRIGLSENEIPYVIPVNFGYKDNKIYFHSAPMGKKIEILKKNNNVCFEIDIDHELVMSDNICNSSMKYRSIIGYGKAFFIDDLNEKRDALNIIMNHYTSNDSHDYNERLLKKLAIIRIKIHTMTGKKSGY
jgi:nitroimidazol reductase NimA-like FMN-containing flavoprotein (pyridoxamine 5'-phosphate oxidase superfamily)